MINNKFQIIYILSFISPDLIKYYFKLWNRAPTGFFRWMSFAE